MERLGFNSTSVAPRSRDARCSRNLYLIQASGGVGGATTSALPWLGGRPLRTTLTPFGIQASVIIDHYMTSYKTVITKAIKHGSA